MPSSWPRYTRPEPMATPRFSQPQQTVVISWEMPDVYFQRIFPSARLTANTSSSPVDTYATPFQTTGWASCEYFEPTPEPSRCVRQTPLSWLTLDASISLEGRVAVVSERPADRRPVLGRRLHEVGRREVRRRLDVGRGGRRSGGGGDRHGLRRLRIRRVVADDPADEDPGEDQADDDHHDHGLRRIDPEPPPTSLRHGAFRARLPAEQTLGNAKQRAGVGTRYNSDT